MSAEEIEQDFRSLSMADKYAKKKEDSFWEKWKADMYKKTVIKQLRKILPPLPEEIPAYQQLNKKEEPVISPERQKLIKQFNEAYTNSGLTAKELKSILYTKYFVNEAADLNDQELAELTQLLKEKGRGLLEAEILISPKEQEKVEKLFAEKQFNEDEKEQLYLFLGMEPSKIPNQEEYDLLIKILTENTREEILEMIGYKKQPVQTTIEDLENI